MWSGSCTCCNSQTTTTTFENYNTCWIHLNQIFVILVVKSSASFLAWLHLLPAKENYNTCSISICGRFYSSTAKSRLYPHGKSDRLDCCTTFRWSIGRSDDLLSAGRSVGQSVGRLEPNNPVTASDALLHPHSRPALSC